MILLGFIFVGGCVGLWVRRYFSGFAQHVAEEVYSAYMELYAPEQSHTMRHRQTVLTGIKCGHFLRYFCSFATFFACCLQSFTNPKLAGVFALYASLLFVIAVIDWRYKLISPALCQFLLAFGIGAAHENITPLSLEQSLHSALLGFTAFFVVYHLARFYYRREAFGRGDYWLIAGLAAFIPWQMLPLMILSSCLSALSYALWLKCHGRETGFLPFAPFLSIGGIFTFLLNNASIA